MKKSGFLAVITLLLSIIILSACGDPTAAPFGAATATPTTTNRPTATDTIIATTKASTAKPSTGVPTATDTIIPTSNVPKTPTPKPTNPAPSDSIVSIDKPFQIALGQEVSIPEESLSLKFSRVISDSRCPENVACVWQGELTSGITLTKKGNNLPEVALSTLPTKQDYLNLPFKPALPQLLDAGVSSCYTVWLVSVDTPRGSSAILSLTLVVTPAADCRG